jgi:hypothetical protein
MGSRFKSARRRDVILANRRHCRHDGRLQRGVEFDQQAQELLYLRAAEVGKRQIERAMSSRSQDRMTYWTKVSPCFSSTGSRTSNIREWERFTR